MGCCCGVWSLESALAVAVGDASGVEDASAVISKLAFVAALGADVATGQLPRDLAGGIGRTLRAVVLSMFVKQRVTARQ